MSKEREALKLALEALEYASTGNRRPEIIGPAITAIREALAQPAQEPVAWISKRGVVYPLDAKYEVHPINELQPLYIDPPKRPWVGLTDNDYLNALDNHPYEGSDRELWLVLEAKLKELNT